MKHSSELLHSTCAFWQRQCRQRLTDEDARQIIENIRGFFGVLESWHCCKSAAMAEGAKAVSDSLVAALVTAEPSRRPERKGASMVVPPKLEKTA
jgi:hypothetical protein